MNPDTHTNISPDEWPLGAHLVSPRRGYTHHGIYVGSGRVIHYAGLSRGWWSAGSCPVEEVSLERFCWGRPVAVLHDVGARHQGAACVERARQRLGENSYSLWRNNCEHFCSWCAYGVSRSAQVEALRERLQRILPRLGRLNVARAQPLSGQR